MAMLLKRRCTLVAISLAIAQFSLAATACSTTAATSTGFPAPTVTATPEPELTPDRLMVELRARGFEFEPARGDDFSFSRMYGFVQSLNYMPLDAEDSDPVLQINEFIGPAEALVGATRLKPEGTGFIIPTNNDGGSTVGGAYGFPQNLNVLVKDRIIVWNSGGTTNLNDALEFLMGEPFAGTRAYGKWNIDDEDYSFAVNYPKFADMWIEEPAEAKDFTVTPQEGTADTGGASVSIRFSINEPHSVSCVGQRIYKRIVEGNELRIVYLNSIADTDVLHFVNDCVINHGWREIREGFSQLETGTMYTIRVNDEIISTFEAP